MEKHWTLSNINIYSILCPTKLRNYNQDFGNRYAKEDVIYFEHKEDRNVYLVSGGKVKLINYDSKGNEIVRQILIKGELFGENLLLGELERNEFAVACDENTSICKVDITTLRELMRTNENFSTAVYKFIGLKFKKIERRLDLLVGKDVTTRIASYVMDLYRENGTLSFDTYLTQKDMAALLATSRESVAKVLSQLKTDGVINYSRSNIAIVELDKLQEMAGE